MSGWIGVDFDRTLAIYDGWKGELHTGEPIPKMVEFVKRLLAQGQEVRIFTARVSKEYNSDGSICDKSEVISKIQIWTKNIFGVALKVTNEKDYECVALFDDIAFNVIPNTGIIENDRWVDLVN